MTGERSWVGALALLAALVILALLTLPRPRPRPNILIIVSDDQRFDTMAYMPRAQSLIFDQGMTFANAYVTTANCCPSRSSILTGLYAHTHGVLTNGKRYQLTDKTFVAYFHEAGYTTGIVGKYLNNYPVRERGDPPLPEFDWWVAHGGDFEKEQGAYTNYELNVNGKWQAHTEYLTFAERDYALDFLRLANERDRPFALIFAPHAPHKPADPAPGDETLYPNLPPHRPPSFNEADMSDKPNWIVANWPEMGEKAVRLLEERRRRQLQSLNALDQAVEALLLELQAQGKLDNTLVIYLSDNGVLWGEHRAPASTKRVIYEEAIRVPFAIRFPPLISPGSVETLMVANIDIAPTLYDLVGITPERRLDGRSLLPLLRGSRAGWREALFFEDWADMPYLAIHTGRYVYLEAANDRYELYDLQVDPYQLDNRIDDPAYADVLKSLRRALRREKGFWRRNQ